MRLISLNIKALRLPDRVQFQQVSNIIYKKAQKEQLDVLRFFKSLTSEQRLISKTSLLVKAQIYE